VPHAKHPPKCSAAAPVRGPAAAAAAAAAAAGWGAAFARGLQVHEARAWSLGLLILPSVAAVTPDLGRGRPSEVGQEGTWPQVVKAALAAAPQRCTVRTCRVTAGG